jgi:hypothetical protein
MRSTLLVLAPGSMMAVSGKRRSHRPAGRGLGHRSAQRANWPFAAARGAVFSPLGSTAGRATEDVGI